MLAVLLVIACDEPGPVEVADRFEVVGAVRGGAEVPAEAAGATGAQGEVAWAREVWEVAHDKLTLERDVLFRGPGGRFTACEAAVTIQVAWTDGVMMAPYTAREVSRVRSADPASPLDLSCEAEIQAGEWGIYRAGGVGWTHEARAQGTGDVVRLRLATGSPEYRAHLGSAP